MVAAAAASDLSASRYWVTLAGLLAVALVLLIVYRSVPRALVPLAPVAARRRLVGARPLGQRHPAQPDVGGARAR